MPGSALVSQAKAVVTSRSPSLADQTTTKAANPLPHAADISSQRMARVSIGLDNR